MSMIRGKVEIDREVSPKEITFGRIPYQKKDNQWEPSSSGRKVIEVDFEKFLEEEVVPTIDQNKKSARELQGP